MTQTQAISGFFGNQMKSQGVDPRTRDLNLLKAAGASDDQLNSIEDRDSAVALAEKLGITLPEPPEPPTQGQDNSIFAQAEQAAAGQQMSGGQPPSGPPPEVVSALQAGGATPAEISAISGPEDAEALASKYGVNLPAPPAKPEMASSSGNSFDISTLMANIAELIPAMGISVE